MFAEYIGIFICLKKYLLNFPCYTKFLFAHCSKVTRESQGIPLIEFKVNEHYLFSAVHLPIWFFSVLFFMYHLHSVDLSVSASASKWAVIEAILVWIPAIFFRLFLTTFIYSSLPQIKKQKRSPYSSTLTKNSPEMLLKPPLTRPATIHYPITALSFNLSISIHSAQVTNTSLF